LHVWASLRIRPQLRAYCQTEDLLQEVWCRTYAIRDRFDSTTRSFRSWIFTVAKNVLLEVVQRAESEANYSLSNGIHMVVGP
jgi:DNA-directed RNA polymerase specialized sigma24 family protein